MDRRVSGGKVGLVGVRHTWTRELAYHPHSHYLMPGGGLSLEGGQWLLPCSAAWLVFVRTLSRLFWGKFHAALTTAGLDMPLSLPVWQKAWVPIANLRAPAARAVPTSPPTSTALLSPLACSTQNEALLALRACQTTAPADDLCWGLAECVRLTRLKRPSIRVCLFLPHT
jgi:hypothetical protein